MSRALAVSGERIAAVCGLLLGVLTLAFVLTNFFLPAGIYDTEAVLVAAAAHPGLYWLFFSEWAALGLLGLAVVGSFTRLVVPKGRGWVEWASVLAYLGNGVTAVQAMRIMVSLPNLGQLYEGCHTCTASLADQQTLAKWLYGSLALDPQNVLMVGGVGLWILAVSAQGLAAHSTPRGPLFLGMLTAALYIVLVVVGFTNVDLNIPLLLAAVASAVWYGWMGLLLFRRPPEAAA